MLSVLIPTYNYVCYPLVTSLQSQLEASGCAYEIIVMDDASDDETVVEINEKTDHLPHCRYEVLDENVSRAAIRNKLVLAASYDWLLFLDNDAEMISPDFISRYLEAISIYGKGGVEMIVGGMRHPEQQPSPEVSLRYRYEKEADRHRSAAERQLNPYQHLTFFNLCVTRQLMLRIPFDETCREYGYEDALLGVRLKEVGVKIQHIDNPMCHAGLESNAVYLSKVETALRTLHRLGDQMQTNSHVGRAAQRIQRLHLTWLVDFCFFCAKSLLRRNLLGQTPSLSLLKLYKLGYLISINS